MKSGVIVFKHLHNVILNATLKLPLLVKKHVSFIRSLSFRYIMRAVSMLCECVTVCGLARPAAAPGNFWQWLSGSEWSLAV